MRISLLCAAVLVVAVPSIATAQVRASDAWAGRPELFGLAEPRLRGDGTYLRLTLDSSAVIAVLQLREDGILAVKLVEGREPGTHTIRVSRASGSTGGGVTRVPFTVTVVGRGDPGPLPTPAGPSTRPPPPHSASDYLVIIVAGSPLDSASLAARVGRGILASADSLAEQLPRELIEDVTVPWAAWVIRRR